MRKINRLLFAGALLAGITGTINADNVLINTPEGYEILSVSPNGKWACGAFRDMTNSFYGFRWNLESGVIETLGDEPSMAYDIANDGTVSGEFSDKSIFPNEVGWIMPGYWKDGAWHGVEIPEGCRITDEGIGYGISSDGKYMTGSIPVNGLYTPFIWKEGKIHRQLPQPEGKSGVGFHVSPDGNRATGFTDREKNRTACYWDAEGNIRYLDECADYAESMFNYGRRFSPDGTKLVYWGGLEPSEDMSTAMLYCIYDITTDRVTRVAGSSINSDVEFHSMTDDCTLVGQEFGRGFIWSPEEGGKYIDEYLEEKGVEYGEIFYDFYTDLDFIPITVVPGISADGKVLGMRYVTKDAGTASLVVKLDQDLSSLPPVDVTGEQLSGVKSVSLKWKKPVGATVNGYTVYRDNVKISGFMPIRRTYFYDKNLQPGTYQYQVAAVSVGGTETKCEPFTVTVTEGGATSVQPYNLTARQKGVNNAVIEWEAPMSTDIHKNYADPSAPNLSTINIYEGIELETAVRFSKEELENYTGCKVAEMSFRPMGANLAWVVNLYSYDPDSDELTLIEEKEISEELEPNKTYTVKFDTPVDLPEGDLVASVLTLIPGEGGQPIAAVSGKAEPGYSDWMRSPDEFEDEFFSITESSAESGTFMSLSWAIDLGLTDPDGTVSTLIPTGYNLYLDDAEAVQTDDLRYLAEDLADGVHSFAVEATYSDGSVSGKTASQVTISANYPVVREVEVTPGEEAQSKHITATWQAPRDEDRTEVSYVTAAKPKNGIQSPESAGYEYMAASRYPAKRFAGYEGYEINAVRFYPMTDAEYTILLVEGEDILTGMTVTEYNKNAWNEVKLPESVTVKSGKEYMLAIYVGNPTPETDGLGIDDNPPLDFYSDLFSLTGGQSWMSLGADAGITGSWMMGLVMADPDGEEMDVDGYDVVIDRRKRNTEPVTGNSFDYDFSSFNNRQHDIRIDVYYPAKTEAVEGVTTYFYLGNSGIENAVINTIQLVKGDNYLVAQGDGVESLAIFDLGGVKAASAKGNKVEISSLSNGIYIVEIVANGKKETKKISITK